MNNDRVKKKKEIRIKYVVQLYPLNSSNATRITTCVHFIRSDPVYITLLVYRASLLASNSVEKTVVVMNENLSEAPDGCELTIQQAKWLTCEARLHNYT